MREWLAEARKKLDLSTRQVAKLAEIAPSYYSMIENGQRVPSGRVAMRLSKILDVDMVLFYSDVHSDESETVKS